MLSGSHLGLGRSQLAGFEFLLRNADRDFFVTLDPDGHHDARQITDVVRAFRDDVEAGLPFRRHDIGDDFSAGERTACCVRNARHEDGRRVGWHTRKGTKAGNQDDGTI